MNTDMGLEEQRLLRRKKKSSEAENWQQLAETCRKLGELYSDRGEHGKARNEYKLVAQAYHKLKMPMEVGRAYRMVGEMFMLMGEFEKALKYEKEYLDIARREEDKVELQRAYVTIGRTYLLKGQSCDGMDAAKEPLAEAEKAFHKGLKLSRELPEVGKLEQFDMEARVLLNLGVTKEHQGHLEEALQYMHKATKIAQNNDLLDLLHQCYITSALLFNVKQTNHTKALKVLSEALEVASRLSNKPAKMCETLLIKADAMIRMGDFHSAKQALKKAFKLKTPVVSDAENIERQLKVLVAICRVEDELITTDSSEYGKKKILFEKMGDGACKLENYGKAIGYYLKTLECAQLNGEADQELVPIYVSLYKTYTDNKQFDDALIYLWKEYYLIQDIPKEAYNTLLSIAEVYEAQERSFFDTEAIYRRVRQEAKKMNSLKMERIPLKRCISLLKKYAMDLMAENLEKEAKDLGIDLAIEDANDGSDDDSEDKQDETETSIEFAINTPDIGDDVDLDELSDSDEDSSKLVEKQSDVRSSRKRGMSFQIKRNNKGETQLHQACIAGNKLLVQKLLEQGHPINIRDHAGWLPLHEACSHGHKEIVEMLLDKGAHINDKGGTSCEGITPLHDACSNGNLDVIEFLLDRGANCTQRTDNGVTTLQELDLWFKRVQKKLLVEDIAFYNTIRDRITTCFDKAGIKPTEGGSVPESMEVEPPPSGATRSTRRRTNRLGRSGSDSERDETRTVRTVTSNRSSGYGSSKGTPHTSARKRPPDIVSDSASDTEPDPGPSRSFREKSSRRSSGVDDYRTAIQVLRKGNAGRAQIVSPLKDPNPGPAKRGAYMRQEEVGDDWLVDDLGPNIKRQKFLSEKDYAEPNQQQIRPAKRSFERDGSPREAFPISDRTVTSTGLVYDSDEPYLVNVTTRRSERASSEESGHNAHQILMNASGKSFSRKPSAQSKMHRQRSNGSFNRNQISLLEVGFNMSTRSDSPPIGQMESSLMTPTKSSVGQRTPVKAGTVSMVVKRTPVKILPPNMVRVIVDGESIDVSYDEEIVIKLNVGWLINEVVKRYGIKHGKRPLMKLLRPDGGLCMDTDPLTTLLCSSDSIINSYVIEFEQMRSDQFYAEYCKHRDVELLSELLQSLSTMENTGHFILRRDFFSAKPRQWDILFQALGYQGRVRELNLSFNQLTDADFQELTLKLPSFKLLEKLNLSMNSISHKGMNNLSTLLAGTATDGTNALSTALSHLTELDLSRNPLMDQSLMVLTSVCQQLKQLKILRLTSTGITNLTFATPPLDITQLQVLDVSENNLNKKSIDYVFIKLNTRILTELNLHSLGKLRDFKPAFILALQSNDFDMLRTLNLSNCNLTDADLSAVVFSLKTTAEKLKHLDVSFNAKLTQKSLVEVLQSFTNQPLELVRLVQNPLVLKGFGANDMIGAIEYDRDKSYPYRVELMVPLRLSEEQIEELRHLLTVFWERIWKERAVVEVNKNKVKLSMRL